LAGGSKGVRCKLWLTEKNSKGRAF